MLHEDFDFPQNRVKWGIDSVSTDVDLGLLHTGDTLAYILYAHRGGTTQGFERGYDAFLGDPFGVDVVDGNLSVTVAPAAAPEPSTSALTLLGITGLLVWRRRAHRARGLIAFQLVLSRSIRIRTGYSWRNALMGSTRVARCAGMYVAKRATRNMAPGTTR